MGTESNVAIAPYNVLWNNIDLGFTEGAPEIVPPALDMIDLKTNQTGSTVLDKFITGVGVSEVTVTLLEVTAANIQKFIEALGGTYTPGAGTKVSGIGTSKQFEGVKQYAQKLHFSPVGSANATLDFCFFSAVPKVDSISITGEDFKKLTVTFMCFVDSTAKRIMCIRLFVGLVP
jgi:hypothetical protein